MEDFNYEGFIKILRNKQEDLLNYLPNQLNEIYDENNRIITKDFLYFRGESPVCLVSHLDTVHKELPENVLYEKSSGLMWSPQGIGGDDRCGTFALLSILASQLENNKQKPTMLFTTNEEVGCVGASVAANKIPKEMMAHIKFLVEIDRRGIDDCVFYNTRNAEFEKFIEGFGFTKNRGSCSDISKLSPVLNVASTNVSAGYFNEHTKSEYINVTYLMDTINKVINILNDDRTLNGDKFEYQPDPEPVYKYDYSNYSNKNKPKSKWTNYNYDYYDDYDYLNGDFPYEEEEKYLQKLYGKDWKKYY